MRVSSRGVLAWCVVCGVHEAASVGVNVGQPSPSCLVVRPFVVALPTVWSFVCPGAASCAYSCSAQDRCGRCPLGFGVMSDFVCFFFGSKNVATASEQDDDNSGSRVPRPHAKGVNHLETPLRRLCVTHRVSYAKRGGHIYMTVFKAQLGTRTRSRGLLKKGSPFITSSDHAHSEGTRRLLLQLRAVVHLATSVPHCSSCACTLQGD